MQPRAYCTWSLHAPSHLTPSLRHVTARQMQSQITSAALSCCRPTLLTLPTHTGSNGEALPLTAPSRDPLPGAPQPLRLQPCHAACWQHTPRHKTRPPAQPAVQSCAPITPAASPSHISSASTSSHHCQDSLPPSSRLRSPQACAGDSPRSGPTAPPAGHRGGAGGDLPALAGVLRSTGEAALVGAGRTTSPAFVLCVCVCKRRPTACCGCVHPLP